MTSPRTVELPPLDIRADLGSVNEEARTVDVIFSTGAAVDRFDYWTGKRYVEKLSLDPKHIRLDRLNAGAAVLDTHSGYSLANVMGAVEPGSARVEKGVGVATLRFARTPDVENVWQKVRDGIVRFVSVGYRVHKFIEDTAEGKVPTRTAVDWEPYEVSMVPMPADAGAKVRAGDVTFNPCLIEGAVMEERAMKPETTQPEVPAAPAATPAAAPAVPSTDAVRAEAAQAERARIAGINQIASFGNVPAAFAQRHIDAGSTIDQVRADYFANAAAKTDETGPAAGPQVRMGEDAQDKMKRGVTAWILQRSGMAALVAQYEKTDVADPGEFRGLSLLDLARLSLERAGVSTRGMDTMRLAGLALSHRSSYQTTSDFANLLENALHKVLRSAYALTPDTWSRWCGVASVSDFRSHIWHRTGALSSYDDLGQHGEFVNKAIPDSERATFSASTKGNIIAITRQVIVNDDLGFVTRLTAQLGRAGKLTIEKAAYALLAQNSGLGPTQSDTNPLFHASRANVGSAAAISAAALDADRVVMAQQTDVGSQEYTDLRPSVLLVPVGLGGQARIINQSQYDPDTLANKSQMKPNIVAGLFSDIVDTPRISGTRRYLFANPSVAPVFVVSFLNGQQEPVLETDEGFRIDGVEMKARLDVGVNAVDWRGAVTNAGA